MLLKDATSLEQVQAALDDDDEELREDIEDKLDDARRWWNRHGVGQMGYDDDSVYFRDVIEDPAFVDAVIEASPGEYELANIPREDVEKDLRWSATHPRRGRPERYGPYYIDDSGDHFSFKVGTSVSAWFPGNHLPDNAEYIPGDLAQEFWDSLDGGVEWERTTIVEEQSGTAEGENVYVAANKEDFVEWCRDLVSSRMSVLLDRDPPAAIKLFIDGLSYENSSIAKKVRAADLPEDELLDFAGKWFEYDYGYEREDVIATLKDYFKSMETGAEEPREVLGEWSQDDLRALGITKGPLFEEAPWKLLKLHPSDLRLEGTLMRHCVGDKGMGYIKALSDGEIELWSLRSQKNKPRFTLEVDSDFYDTATSVVPHDSTPAASAAYLRAAAIKQIKGKANRTPGFADKHQTGGLRFPDEVAFWHAALTKLGAEPESVEDMDDGLTTLSADETLAEYRQHGAWGRAPVRPNRDEVCTGFDLPYRPR